MTNKNDYLKHHTIEEWREYIKKHSSNKEKMIAQYGEKWYADLLERNRNRYHSLSDEEKKQRNKKNYLKQKKKFESKTNEEKEYRLAKHRKQRIASYYKDLDKSRESGRQNYYNHRLEYIEKNREWKSNNPIKTREERGRSKAKRRGRGFQKITTPLKGDFDWHHVARDLSYVIAVPRKLHRSIGGNSVDDHYSTVNGLWLVEVGKENIKVKFKK